MIETNSCSEMNLADNLYATQADTTEVFTKDIAVVGVGTYPIIQNAPYQGRISGITVTSSAGSGVFSIKIGTVNVTGLVGKVFSTLTTESYIPNDLNLFSVGEEIYLVISEATNVTNVSVSVSVLREVGTATPTTTDSTDPDAVSAAYLEKVSAALPTGFILVDVPFGTTKLDSNGAPTSNYDVNSLIVENLTDTIPDRIFVMLVDKTPTKITLLLSAAPTTSNTIFRATIATASAATNFLSAGSSTGGGAVVATTSLPLRGDGSGDAIAITQVSGDAATGLANLNLFSSTPTYDSAKLTGTINQARLGTGSTGSGSKVLYDDQTYKTPSSSGNLTTDTIWDAKGDLIVGSGSDTAIKLPLGANSEVLTAQPGTATGAKWEKLNQLNFTPTYINGADNLPTLRSLDGATGSAAAYNDARITGALQVANNLSEFSITFDDVRQSLNFGTIVYEALPGGGGSVMGTETAQNVNNKFIDANTNTITNLSAANFSGDVIDLVDPNADRLLVWNDTTGAWEWLQLGPGHTITGTSPNLQLNYISAINSKSAAYTTLLADAEKTILHPVADNNARTFTIDSNANVAYPIGTKIHFINQINTVTVSIATDTMTLSGGTSTGSRTLAAYGNATAQKIATTSWVIWGTNLT